MNNNEYSANMNMSIGMSGTLEPHIYDAVNQFKAISPYEGRRPRHPEQPIAISAIRPSLAAFEEWYMATRSMQVERFRGLR